jgi:hypothetical protein
VEDGRKQDSLIHKPGVRRYDHTYEHEQSTVLDPIPLAMLEKIGECPDAAKYGRDGLDPDRVD